MKKFFFILLSIFGVNQELIAQGYSISERDGTTLIVNSYNPKDNQRYKESQMLNLYLPGVLNRNFPQSGGLVAEMAGPGGFAKVSIYIYDKTKTNGLGPLVYKAYTDVSSTDNDNYIEKPETTHKISEFNPNVNVPVKTTDVQRMFAANVIGEELVGQKCGEATIQKGNSFLTNALMGIGAGCGTGGVAGAIIGASATVGVFTFPGFVVGCAAGAVVGFFAALYNTYNNTSPIIVGTPPPKCVNVFFPLKPMVVQLEISNAILKKVKIPIHGELILTRHFPLVNEYFEVNLKVNENEAITLTYPQKESDIPIINLTMGDDLDFTVIGSLPENTVRPRIYGLPKVWEAPFAGDLYFHCDPNFGPATINPFIGFDSRVHTLMLRKFPDNYSIVEKDWDVSINNEETTQFTIFDWKYTAQREMDPDILNYKQDNYYRWAKRHKNKDGTLKNQRQNQKEGLNMKFLHHWYLPKMNSFSGEYFGKANYMMGFDDDELAYFNHPFKETNGNHPLGTDKTQTGVAKLETLQWKELLEGETKYDERTGYSVEGDPLNMMVNAFRRNQYNKYKNYNPKSTVQLTPYYGYEIQDIGTSPTNPRGGQNQRNLAHPGLVTIDYGGLEVKVKLRVVNPFIESGQLLDSGFYNVIEGSDAPSNAESNAGYYILGVENQDESEQKKYKINYKWMNRLGKITTKTISMYDIIQAKQGKTWTSWVNDYLPSSLKFDTGTNFDLARPAYSWFTATYQRTYSSKPVIVGGKELNQIFLMFCGIKSYNNISFPEGKGQGANIWLEDFRSKISSEYTEPKKFGDNLTKYSKKYFKNYVFNRGDQVVFTTFDGDPHRFDNDEEEWYLSNRSIANRVKNELLYNVQNPNRSYLKYYIGPVGSDLTEITQGRSGKELTYQFNSVGEYDLRVEYRGGSDLLLKILVKDPIPADALGTGLSHPAKPDSNGIIEKRPLTPDEKTWLDLSGDLALNARVLELKDVKTNFAYKDGFRSYGNKPLGDKLANRWSKFNDYADSYIWFTTSVSSNTVFTPLYKKNVNMTFKTKVDSFLNSYEIMMESPGGTWMWKDWANHYSSVWKGKLKGADGLDGLPPYTPANTVTRLNELLDLDTNFGAYIDREIFASDKYLERKKAPWQFVIPLVSTTEYHGYRQRSNPSCIYDIRKIFNKDNGAFSGTPYDPNLLKPENIQAPETLDETKNKQEFYYNIKYGRIVIVHNNFNGKVRVSNVIGSQLDVLLPENEMKFVAQKTLGYNPKNNVAKSVTKQEETPINPKNIGNLGLEALESNYNSEVIFPNPSSGVVDIILGNAWNHDLINIHVFNGMGQEVYKQQFRTFIGGEKQFSIDLSSLSAGNYVLKGSYENDFFSKLLILE